MRSMFRNLVLAPAVMAAVVTAATSAMAATTRLDVPFSFTANGKICPAGQYEVNVDAMRSIVSLKSMDKGVAGMWSVGPGDPAPNSSRVVLQFDQQGGEYTLRAVQYGAKTTSRLDKAPKHGEQGPVRTVEGL